ncbi:MAG TPA: DUF2243 domain-containing protein [Sphingobacteriaceae bacterium]
MKKGILIFMVLLVAGPALGCTTCNPDLQKAIFNSSFYPNLLTMLSAFIVLGVVVMALAFMVRKRERQRFGADPARLTAVPLIAAATTLGIAFGGFIDGIFFHQVLQWHEMLSFRIPPTTLMNKSVNMFWDGVFHAFCLIVAITGLYLLLQLFFRKDVLITRTAFTGGLILGWGIFNIVEGSIDHHLLRLHNVKETAENVLMWNYGFLAVSVLQILTGARVIRRGIPDQFCQNRASGSQTGQ